MHVKLAWRKRLRQLGIVRFTCFPNVKNIHFCNLQLDLLNTYSIRVVGLDTLCTGSVLVFTILRSLAEQKEREKALYILRHINNMARLQYIFSHYDIINTLLNYQQQFEINKLYIVCLEIYFIKCLESLKCKFALTYTVLACNSLARVDLKVSPCNMTLTANAMT